MSGNGEPVFGLLSDRDEEKKKIIDMIRMLTAKEGYDCSIYNFSLEETEGWENISCVILAWKDREDAFRCAEKLWEKAPSLLIIYVAHKVEDVVAALGLPFFHIVRLFGLEQDLEAALKKLYRVRLPAADRVCFTRNGQIMLIPVREILYLESERHEIRLHLAAEVFVIKENLSQCEEKLKGRGFTRVYTSFLVNMYHIRRLEKEKVALNNGEELFVSRRRYPEVNLMFENYIRHLDFI